MDTVSSLQMRFSYHRWGESDFSRSCHSIRKRLVVIKILVEERRRFEDDDVLRSDVGKKMIENEREEMRCRLEGPRLAIFRGSAVIGQYIDDDDVAGAVVCLSDFCVGVSKLVCRMFDNVELFEWFLL